MPCLKPSNGFHQLPAALNRTQVSSNGLNSHTWNSFCYSPQPSTSFPNSLHFSYADHPAVSFYYYYIFPLAFPPLYLLCPNHWDIVHIYESFFLLNMPKTVPPQGFHTSCSVCLACSSPAWTPHSQRSFACIFTSSATSTLFSYSVPLVSGILSIN